MSFLEIPIQIKEIIISLAFIEPSVITNKEVKYCARNIVNISLIDKESLMIINKTYQFKLSDLKKLNSLITKYHKYNIDYQTSAPHWFFPQFRHLLPGGNPQLLDALFVGNEFSKSSIHRYTPQVEEDICDLIRLTPESIHCRLGRMKHREFVTPLVAACMNEKIPLHIVKILLEKGADPNTTYVVGEHMVHILKDLKENLTNERFTAIKTLFEQHIPKMIQDSVSV